jgi:hypothetical protein
MRHEFALLLGTALAACAETTPLPTDNSETAPSLAAVRSAGRASGAVVIRWEGNTPEVGLFIYDAGAGLLAGLATDDSNFGCVEGTELGHSSDQMVETPAGRSNYLSQVDQVYLTIYAWDGVGDINCALVTGSNALAFGIVPGVFTGNAFGPKGQPSRMGMGVQGEVTWLTDGGIVHANARFQDHFLPDGSVESVVARVSVTPDPRR